MPKDGIFIYGNRLTEAREARGLSISELADSIGRNRQSISCYEKGVNSPNLNTLREIADVLNVPVAFFLRENPYRQILNSPIFYRSFKKALESVRKQINWKTQWVADLIGYHESKIDFPEPNIYISDADIGRLDDEQIESIAVKVRRQWGLGDGPISNVTLLCENMGIIVATHNEETKDLEACSTIANGRPVILVNTFDTTCARMRMSIAHELGHIVLHTCLENDQSYLKENFDLIEEQAWKFAGFFLMPSPTFLSEVRSASISAFAALKERWGVAISAMIMRCYRADIIDSSRREYLYKEMSRLKIRKREPLDDIPLEKPHLLYDADVLLDGVFQKSDRLEKMALQAEDYAALIGAPNDYFKSKPQVPTLRLITNE